MSAVLKQRNLLYPIAYFTCPRARVLLYGARCWGVLLIVITPVPLEGMGFISQPRTSRQKCMNVHAHLGCSQADSAAQSALFHCLRLLAHVLDTIHDAGV